MAHPSWGGLKLDGWESQKTMWWESFFIAVVKATTLLHFAIGHYASAWQRNWTSFERQIKVFFPLTVVYYLWPLLHFPLFLMHSGHTSISRVLSKNSQDINLPYVSVPCLPFGGKGYYSVTLCSNSEQLYLVLLKQGDRGLYLQLF